MAAELDPAIKAAMHDSMLFEIERDRLVGEISLELEQLASELVKLKGTLADAVTVGSTFPPATEAWKRLTQSILPRAVAGTTQGLLTEEQTQQASSALPNAPRSARGRRKR